MSSLPMGNNDAYSKSLNRAPSADYSPREVHSAASAVSWGAIFAGAAAAATLSLVLLLLGTGLGLSVVSPWAHSGISATSLGWSSIIWITLTQIAAAGLGGYVAGRLRSRWLVAHRDEVYFRDTAHGFLAWAVATLATAALLTSAVSMIVGSGVSLAGGAITAGAGLASQESASSTLSYYVDRVLRKDANAATPTDTAIVVADPREPEMLRLFAKNIKAGTFAEDDLRYAAQWVAQRTGMPQAQAQARVSAIYAEAQAELQNAETSAKQAANTARKASAYTTLWLVIALMLGAFFASLAAPYGGRQSDA